MYVMPKKTDRAVRDRAVRLIRQHLSECPLFTAVSGSGTSSCAGGCCKLMSTIAADVCSTSHS